MPSPKLLLRSILSIRDCTPANSDDCESSMLLTGSSNSNLSNIAIIFIAVASLIGLLLLIAYVRHYVRASKQCHMSLPEHHSPNGPNPPPSSHPPTNATRSRRQPQSSKVKKSKFADPPPAYAVENRSETVLERAPGLMIVPAPREGEERVSSGGEELLAPLHWRERERDSAPAYSIDETVYSRDGPTLVEAQSGLVVKVKGVSRSEAGAAAGS